PSAREMYESARNAAASGSPSPSPDGGRAARPAPPAPKSRPAPTSVRKAPPKAADEAGVFSLDTPLPVPSGPVAASKKARAPAAASQRPPVEEPSPIFEIESEGMQLVEMTEPPRPAAKELPRPATSVSPRAKGKPPAESARARNGHEATQKVATAASPT